MTTKVISNTYLRDIEDYEMKLYLDIDWAYICVKKLIKCREKFIIKNNLCVMDDGYYIFEVVPKNSDYAMRLFLDKYKKPLEYYFDVCRNVRLDEKFKIPMYDDLRSLNLSNSVAIILYEALRQMNFKGLTTQGQLHKYRW